ncbi:MAG: AMP-binding protein, partial [Pseudomonadota bacterium]
IWDAVYGKLVYRPLRDVLGMTRIRAAYTAGDALDPAMLSFFRSLGINIKQVYGTTETGYFDTLQRDGEVVAGSVGRAVDGVELQIAEDGEVLVRSPGLCKSMLGPDGRSAPAIDADGWLPTGDVGEINDRGDLIITDRKSDIGAMADGTRFVPRPIENRLRHSPLIREAVVFGNGRDRVCALIDINTGSVAQWADGEGMTYTGHADLAAQPETCKLIAERVAEINDVLAKDGMAHAQIRRFVLLPQELSAEDGLLTRSGRLKRDAIGERYSGLIDALYGSADKVTIERQTEDQEDTQAVLRIQDVEARGHTSNRRAA